jgi:hypothetical protein
MEPWREETTLNTWSLMGGQYQIGSRGNRAGIRGPKLRGPGHDSVHSASTEAGEGFRTKDAINFK